MKRTHGLLLAGVIAFMVTLVVRLPAAVAIGWFAPAALQVNGASGSVWNGSSRELTVSGLRLTDTQWTLSALDLFRGRLGAEIETRLGDGAMRGSVVLQPSGGIQCNACRFEGTAAALRPLIPSLRTVNGRIDMDLNRLEIEDRWPVRLIGVARLSSVTFDNMGPEVTGGEALAFKVDISADPVPDSGVIEALVSDSGGPLECNARALITPPGNFELKGRVKARPGATKEISAAVSSLGPGAADGSTELSISGSF